METRSLATNFESKGNTLTGYAAVWDSPAVISEKGRTFTEVIRRGSFRTAVESRADVVAMFNHDPARLLGRVSSGTLRLHEDNHGLRFEVDLPESAADVRELVQRGDLKGASFTFQPRKNGEKWDGNQRELTDVFLHELGPVVFPAYPATSLGIRSQLPLMSMRLKLHTASIDNNVIDNKDLGGK